MLPLLLTKNFTRQEMSCPCCHKCEMSDKFMEALQALRDDYGQPIIVTSGYRCRQHNDRIRGAKDSQHVYGNAVDIACDNMFDRYKLVQLALKHGFTGIEISPKHVHLDRRSTTARLMWTDFRTVT